MNKHISQILPFAFIWLTFCACSTSKKTAQLAVNSFTNYVDSISMMNEVWKTQADSLYVEIPIDSVNTGWDTAIVSIEDKKKISLLDVNPCGKKIINDYTTKVYEINAMKKHLSSESKIDFEKSIQKFESLILKDSLLIRKYEYLRNYDFESYRKIR